MLLIEQTAEEKIRQAIAEGQFKHLPGRGKPYCFDGYLYADPQERLFTKILRDHGFLPLPLQLKKEVEQTRARLEALLQAYQEIYARRFHFIIEMMGLQLPYPPRQFYRHPKQHQRFLTHHWPIWLPLKATSQLQSSLRKFQQIRHYYRERSLATIRELNDLIETHNTETIRFLMKNRDRFRIMTTLGHQGIAQWAKYFDRQFPEIPLE